MSLQDKERMRREIDRIKRQLDDMGISYEVSHPAYLMFDNASGECMIFPSQTYDDKLVVFHQVKEWCDTAEDALEACGLKEER